MVTSIRLENKTKTRLEKMKLFPKESYDEIVNRLINIVEEDNVLCKQTVKDLKRAMLDIKKGRTYSHEEVKRKLGL